MDPSDDIHLMNIQEWKDHIEHNYYVLKLYITKNKTCVGINFLFNLLKSYISNGMKDYTEAIIANVGMAEIEFKNMQIICRLLDDTVFNHIETEKGQINSNTQELEIYLCICDWFQSIGNHVSGYLILNLIVNHYSNYSFYDHSLFVTKLIKFVRDLSSVAISYPCPYILECISQCILGKFWYGDQISGIIYQLDEKNSFNHPIMLLPNIVSNICNAIPNGVYQLKLLPKNTPTLAFLIVYSVLEKYFDQVSNMEHKKMTLEPTDFLILKYYIINYSEDFIKVKLPQALLSYGNGQSKFSFKNVIKTLNINSIPRLIVILVSTLPIFEIYNKIDKEVEELTEFLIRKRFFEGIPLANKFMHLNVTNNENVVDNESSEEMICNKSDEEEGLVSSDGEIVGEESANEDFTEENKKSFLTVDDYIVDDSFLKHFNNFDGDFEKLLTVFFQNTCYYSFNGSITHPNNDYYWIEIYNFLINLESKIDGHVNKINSKMQDYSKIVQDYKGLFEIYLKLINRQFSLEMPF